jgi:hypothetical protein
MPYNYEDDDFGITAFKGGKGGKSGNKKKTNPDGKYTSKHVRISQEKAKAAQVNKTK